MLDAFLYEFVICYGRGLLWTAAFWGRRLCVYTEGREKVNGKNDFFEKKVNFLFGGDGRAFR